MSLLQLLLFVCIVGVLVYVLGLLPIPEPFHKIVMVVGVVIVVLACLQALFGISLASLKF